MKILTIFFSLVSFSALVHTTDAHADHAASLGSTLKFRDSLPMPKYWVNAVEKKRFDVSDRFDDVSIEALKVLSKVDSKKDCGTEVTASIEEYWNHYRLHQTLMKPFHERQLAYLKSLKAAMQKSRFSEHARMELQNLNYLLSSNDTTIKAIGTLSYQRKAEGGLERSLDNQFSREKRAFDQDIEKLAKDANTSDDTATINFDLGDGKAKNPSLVSCTQIEKKLKVNGQEKVYDFEICSSIALDDQKNDSIVGLKLDEAARHPRASSTISIPEDEFVLSNNHHCLDFDVARGIFFTRSTEARKQEPDMKAAKTAPTVKVEKAAAPEDPTEEKDSALIQ
jgi:hypothetical protein